MTVLVRTFAAGLALHAPPDLQLPATVLVENQSVDYVILLPPGARATVPSEQLPAHVVFQYRDGVTPDVPFDFGGGADVDGDGDSGTDADIEAFFRCVGPGSGCEGCEISDWDNDGVNGTDADIAAFFRTLAGR